MENTEKKIIKIFIAGSTKEKTILREKKKIFNFICRENERLKNRKPNMAFEVYISTTEPCQEGGQQKVFDKKLEDSDIAIFLFSKRLGQISLNELKIASNQYKKEQNSIRIHVLWKKNYIYEKFFGVYKKLKDIVGSSLDGSYCEEYSSSKELKKKLEEIIDKASGNIHELTDKEKKSDPIYTKNKWRNKLLKLIEKLERKLSRYDDIKYLSEAESKERSKLINEQSKLKKQLREVEEALQNSVQDFFDKKVSSILLTQRQERAYSALRKGNADKALKELNIEDIENEIEKTSKEISGGILHDEDKDKIQQKVEELLLYINIIKMMEPDNDSLDKIDKAYSLTYQTVVKYDLDKSSLVGYVEYLFTKGEIDKAIDIADMLRNYYDKNEQLDYLKAAQLATLMGKLYAKKIKTVESDVENNKSIDEEDIILSTIAIEKFEKALNWYEVLEEARPNIYIEERADIYSNLGEVYLYIERDDKTNECLINAKNIYEDLKADAGDGDDYAEELKRIYNNLALFYHKKENYEEAKEVLNKLKEILNDIGTSREHGDMYKRMGKVCYQLALKNQSKFGDAIKNFNEALKHYKALESDEESSLCCADIYLHLGDICFDSAERNSGEIQIKYKQAEKQYMNAVELYLARKDSAKIQQKDLEPYELDIIKAYDKLRKLYGKQEEYIKARDIIQKQIDAYKFLANNNFEKFAERLASSYHKRGVVCEEFSKSQRQKGTYSTALDKAEDMFKEELGIYQQLVDKYGQKYEEKLAKNYHDFGQWYLKIMKYSNAKEMFDQELKIYELKAQSAPKKYAEKYMEIGRIYLNIGDRCTDELAKEMFDKSIELFKEWFKDGRSKLMFLAEIYGQLGNLYKNKSLYDEALDWYGYAIENYEQLVELDPDKYEIKMIATCNSIANGYSRFGMLYKDKSIYENMKVWLDKALKLIESWEKRNPDKYDITLTKTYCILGNYYLEIGEIDKDQSMFDTVETYLKKALKILEILDCESNYRCEVLNLFGLLYTAWDKYPDADKVFEEAENTCRSFFITAQLYNNWGTLYSKIDSFEEAKDKYIKAIDKILAMDNPNESSLAIYYNNLMVTYSALNDIDGQRRARKDMKETYERLAKRSPMFEPKLVEIYFDLSKSYKDYDDEQSQEYLYKAYEIAKRHRDNAICAEICRKIEQA